MSGLILLGIFFALVFFNVPIAIALGVASTIFVYLGLSPVPMSVVSQGVILGLDNMPLLAVPFFCLAGDIMMETGCSKRLIDFCKALLGGITGGLSYVTVVASGIFAAISGSGPATVSCIGSITIPAMVEDGYDSPFASSLAACAACLGPIIPPSVCFIMYGVVCNVSVTDLFTAGFIPGIMMAAALCIYAFFVCKKRGYGKTEHEEGVAHKDSYFSNLWKAFKEAFFALLMPVIVLGGIYGGICTATEAAVVACLYTLVVGFFIYRNLTFSSIVKILKNTSITSGTVLIMVATATAFGRVLTMAGLPKMIADAITSMSNSRFVVLLLINLFLFIVGMVMESLAAIIILAPILLQVVAPYGLNPVHFGIIMTMNLVIGMVTPPVGVNLFVATRLGKVTITDMLGDTMKMVGVLLVVLMIITYVPWFSTVFL